MDIVEFAEKVMDLKLLDYQKKYLTELYNIYEKDPDSFNKITYPCQRRSAIFDARPLFAVMFRLFNMQKESRYFKNAERKEIKHHGKECKGSSNTEELPGTENEVRCNIEGVV